MRYALPAEVTDDELVNLTRSYYNACGFTPTRAGLLHLSDG